MPNRMLRDWTDSERVNTLSVHAERFFIRLIMKVDDYGTFHGDTRMLKANLYPYLLDTIREADLLRWMAECQKAGLIVLYECEGKKYVCILNFRQRLDKSRSKFPLPNPNDFPELVNELPAELEPEVEVRKRTNTAPSALRVPRGELGLKKNEFVPPTFSEVENYFKLKIGDTTAPNHWPDDKCRNNAAQFFEHYTTNGWVQGGGQPIRDWQAAVRAWIMKGLQGIFDRSAPVDKEKKSDRKRSDSDQMPKLSVIQEELNAMYALWCENPDMVTVVSVTSEHFDCLKKAGGISFSEAEITGVKAKVADYMKQKALEGKEIRERLIKTFGVLKFFSRVKADGWEFIFVKQ